MSAVRKLIDVEITTRQVAERLYDEGFLPSTLPKREEDLALAILKAFEGKGVRFGDLPARKTDLVQIRKHLDLIVRQFAKLDPEHIEDVRAESERFRRQTRLRKAAE